MCHGIARFLGVGGVLTGPRCGNTECGTTIVLGGETDWLVVPPEDARNVYTRWWWLGVLGVVYVLVMPVVGVLYHLLGVWVRPVLIAHSWIYLGIGIAVAWAAARAAGFKNIVFLLFAMAAAIGVGLDVAQRLSDSWHPIMALTLAARDGACFIGFVLSVRCVGAAARRMGGVPLARRLQRLQVLLWILPAAGAVCFYGLTQRMLYEPEHALWQVVWLINAVGCVAFAVAVWNLRHWVRREVGGRLAEA